MKKYIILTLAFLVIITFLLRFSSFRKAQGFTLDELAYTRLAAQISEDPSDYNTVGIYEYYVKKGRKLAPYFKKPLFKHPPLFPFLISVSYKIFGRIYYSGFLVSLFFGIMLIPLTYLLGSTLFSPKIGIYSAILMSIEPINWICSQKIWMETTLVFFGVLSLYFFARAIKRYNFSFMLLSGISAGLSFLTKYPGILFVAIIFVYALCCERWLFKKKGFILSLFIPFIMLAPWFYWNYKIYGLRFISEIYRVHNIAHLFAGPIQEYLFVIGFLSAVTALFLLSLKSEKIRVIFISTLFFILFFILGKNITNSLDFTYIPSSGWIIGMFSKEPWHFYLGRLLELSPFYIFSFLGLFLFAFDKNQFKKYFFLYLWAFIILAFYILWRNYQSRYILSSIIPLVVMSAKTQAYILKEIEKMPPGFVRIVMGVSYGLVILFALLKSLCVDTILAVPNLAAYF